MRTQTSARGRAKARKRIVIGIGIGAAVIAATAAAATIVIKHGEKHAASRLITATTASTPAAQIDVPASKRKPLAYYTGGVSGGLFTPPDATPPTPPPAPAKAEPTEEAKPVEVDPFADFAFKGTVSLNGRAMALIESGMTKDGTYVGVGDDFRGMGSVSALTDRYVAITSAGKTHYLSMSNDWTLTPLSRSAGFLGAGQSGDQGSGQGRGGRGRGRRRGGDQAAAGQDGANRLSGALQTGVASAGPGVVQSDSPDAGGPPDFGPGGPPDFGPGGPPGFGPGGFGFGGGFAPPMPPMAIGGPPGP